MITDISISDMADSIIVSIDGNKLLTYTSVKQPLPLGLVLYFPETSLGIAKTEYALDNAVLGSIKAVELIENGPSKITISLKEDVTYDIARNGNGLSVTFNTITAASELNDELPEPKSEIETAEVVEETPVEPAIESITEEATAQAAEETPVPSLAPG